MCTRVCLEWEIYKLGRQVREMTGATSKNRARLINDHSQIKYRLLRSVPLRAIGSAGRSSPFRPAPALEGGRQRKTRTSYRGAIRSATLACAFRYQMIEPSPVAPKLFSGGEIQRLCGGIWSGFCGALSPTANALPFVVPT